MSVNVKLGNNTITGVDTVKLKDATNDSLYHSFSLPLQPNIHYSSTTAPSDTTKLWVKTDTEPSKISLKSSMDVSTPDSVVSLGFAAPASSGEGWSTEIYYNGYIYRFGYSVVYKIDIRNKTYSSISIDCPYFNCCCVRKGTDVYIFGGCTQQSVTTSSSNYFSNKIYKFSLLSETITQLTTTMSSSWAAMSGVLVGDDIYLYGGYRQTYNNNNKLYYFNTIQETFNTVSSTSRHEGYGVSITYKDGYIYLFGGLYHSTSSSTTIYTNATRYNISTGSWENLTSLSVETYKSFAHVLGNKIYLFFNEVSTGDSKKSVVIYDIVNNSYTSKVISSTNFSGTYMSNDGNTMYCRDGNGNEYKYSIEVLLASDNLLITSGGANNKVWKAINEETFEIESYPSAVYLGDSNNKGQPVESALYDSTNQTWVNI